MGVSDGPGRVATARGMLITQRSRVQIPPPLPRKLHVRGPEDVLPGLFRAREQAFCKRICKRAARHAASPSSPERACSVMSTDTSDPPTINSASTLATWRSASRSVCTYCLMVNATSA